MRYLYLILVYSFASSFFSLLPVEALPFGIKISDLGLALLLPGVLFLVVFSKERDILFNYYFVLIVCLFFLCAVQAGIASLNYGQSILSGLISTRRFWWYLTFILFLLLLNDTDKIRKFLDLLTWIAVGLFVLSIINYINPVIFHHKWAEGHNMRAGIVRAYIPGMDLLTITTIWQITKWLESPTRQNGSMLIGATLFAAHVFRQSRGRLISLTLILLGLLIYKRRFKEFLAATTIALMGFFILQHTMEENILKHAFLSTAENIMENTGTWGGRMTGIEQDFEHFLDYIWIGSGTAALRLSAGARYSSQEIRELEDIANTADLGYTRWLKSFGLIGAFWLSALFYFFLTRIRKAVKLIPAEDRVIPLLASSYIGFVTISSITLNHFMLRTRITLVCFCAAILVRVIWNAQKKSLRVK